MKWEKGVLQSGWNDLWSSATEGAPGLGRIMMYAGVALIVISLVKWGWQSRGGQGMGKASKPVMGMLLIASILVAPTLVIPLLLGILDWIIAIIVNVAGDATQMDSPPTDSGS